MSGISPPTPKRPTRVVRMWHRSRTGWCHAWDVEEGAYRVWKEGTGPLSRMAVHLPKNGNPALGSQVVCGSCGSTDVRPLTMKQEFMNIGPTS